MVDLHLMTTRRQQDDNKMMDLRGCAADAQSKNCRHGGGECQKIGKKSSTSFMDYCLIRSLS